MSKDSDKCFDMAQKEPPSGFDLTGYRCSGCEGAIITWEDEDGGDTLCPFDGMEPCSVCQWDHATRACSECDSTYFCKEHMPPSKMCLRCENWDGGEPDYDSGSPGELAESQAKIQRELK